MKKTTINKLRTLIERTVRKQLREGLPYRDLTDYLKSDFRSWEEDHDNYEDTLQLTSLLQQRFPNLSFDNVFAVAKEWTGYEDDSVDEGITGIQRDINKVDKDLERVTDDMKKLAKQYRESDAEGKERLLPQMKKKTEEKKDLTDKKTELHAKLSAEVEKTDVGAELEDLDETNINESKTTLDSETIRQIKADLDEWPKHRHRGFASFKKEVRQRYKITPKQLEYILSGDIDETNINESKYRDKIKKVVELMTKKHFKEYKSNNTKKKSKLDEYSGPFNSTVLREIVDDLLVGTEMLIDEQYGKVEHQQFRETWNELAVEFERKFNNVIKNTMK